MTGMLDLTTGSNCPMLPAEWRWSMLGLLASPNPSLYPLPSIDHRPTDAAPWAVPEDQPTGGGRAADSARQLAKRSSHV